MSVLNCRWKKDASGATLLRRGKPILEFVAIKRRDTGDWAIPGVGGEQEVGIYRNFVPIFLPSDQGMVDAGEFITATLKREFGEEALNSLEASEEEKREMEKMIAKLFDGGTEVRQPERRREDRGNVNSITISGLCWLCG